MDRFKFRVWDKRLNRYLGNNDPTQMLLENGNLAYLDDEGMKFYEVEQCTGLKDKNGKLIYEGDILKIIDQMIDYIVEVKWNKRMFCYEITPNSANLVFFDLTDNETTVEVIGNIHTNADLLGEE